MLKKKKHLEKLQSSSSVLNSRPTVCLPSVRYPATIEKIDYDKERVLIHYRQWSRRHDEWFPWASPYLRPLERVTLRRQSRNPPGAQPVPHTHCLQVLLLLTRCCYSIGPCSSLFLLRCLYRARRFLPAGPTVASTQPKSSASTETVRPTLSCYTRACCVVCDRWSGFRGEKNQVVM